MTTTTYTQGNFVSNQALCGESCNFVSIVRDGEDDEDDGWWQWWWWIIDDDDDGDDDHDDDHDHDHSHGHDDHDHDHDDHDDDHDKDDILRGKMVSIPHFMMATRWRTDNIFSRYIMSYMFDEHGTVTYAIHNRN